MGCKRTCKQANCDNTFAPLIGATPYICGSNDYCSAHRLIFINKKKLETLPKKSGQDWRFGNKSKQKSMPNPRQKAVRRADKYFSLYIRKKHSNKDGVCKCYTCGKPMLWKQNHKATTHCGHFISRGKETTRWHMGNARPQCMSCNTYKGGKHFEFRMNLVKEKGKDFVEALEHRAMQVSKYSVSDIDRLGGLYKLLYDNLKYK